MDMLLFGSALQWKNGCTLSLAIMADTLGAVARNDIWLLVTRLYPAQPALERCGVMRKSSVKSACVVFALTVLMTMTAAATGREG